MPPPLPFVANELAVTGHDVTLTAHAGAAECTIRNGLVQITECPDSVELAHIGMDARHETRSFLGYVPMLRTI